MLSNWCFSRVGTKPWPISWHLIPESCFGGYLEEVIGCKMTPGHIRWTLGKAKSLFNGFGWGFGILLDNWSSTLLTENTLLKLYEPKQGLDVRFCKHGVVHFVWLLNFPIILSLWNFAKRLSFTGQLIFSSYLYLYLHLHLYLEQADLGVDAHPGIRIPWPQSHTLQSGLDLYSQLNTPSYKYK